MLMILNPAKRPAWQRYVVAILAVALGAAVRAGLLGSLGSRAAFVTFYPAVILAALYGGFGAGLLTTVLSALAAAYFSLEPVGSLFIRHPADWLSVFVFAISCAMISWLAQALHGAHARAAAAEAQVKLDAERRRAEEQSLRYQLLAEHSRDVILYMRRDDGRILEANPAALQTYGYSRDELLSLSIRDLRAPHTLEALAGQMAAADAGSILFETVHQRQDGSTIPVEVSSQGATIGGVRTLFSVVRDITERQRAEEELRRQREWLRVTITSIGDAVLATDTAGSITFLNPVAAGLTGWSEPEALGRPVQDVFRIVNEQTRAEAEDIVARVLREGHAVTLANHTALVTRDGREVPIEDSAAPIKDSAGSVAGVVLVFHDVTEKRRAQQALQEERERLRMALDASNSGTWEWDLRTNENFWSDELWKIYGLEPHICKPTYEAWLHVIVPEDRAMAEQAIQEAARNGTELNVEFRVRCRVGEERWLMARAQPLRDAEGRPVRYIGIALDITERKRAEESLRNSEATLRGILNAVRESIWMFSPEGVFLLGNETALSRLGKPAEEVLGKHFHEVQPAELAESRLAWVKEVVKSDRPAEFEDERAGIMFRHSFYPVTDAQGRVASVACFSRDITERKRAEERLLQTQKLESLGLLAGGVAHDFNNLLVGVIGNASLAQDLLPAGNPAAELIEGIVRTGGELAHLTRQMLAYSGKGRFVVEPLNLSDLLPEMSRLAQPSIPKKVRLRLEPSPDLPCVEADRGQMQQVFLNLVMNAGEAMGGQAGAISLRTGVQEVDEGYIGSHSEAADLSPGRYVCLEVRDTGSGMDAATQAKIFDPFFSTKFLGRGLGLAAVAGIVRGHHGAILVESAPCEGSRFTVLLPAVERAPAETPPLAANSDLRGSGTVLVVDDEEVVRTMAKRVLERSGYQVLVAESGLAALDILKRHAGDIAAVLLDLSMPGMSGEETLPELRKIRPGAKVVISSGYSETETMRLFAGQKVSGFIQKPYTATVLAQKLKAAAGAQP